MNKLLIATTNKAKFMEIGKYLSDLKIQLVSLSDLNISDKPEENGSTFEENAMIKARYYLEKSGLPTLADDGGFEIDYLDGQPGVISHRWVNKDREDTDREVIDYAISKLAGVPAQKRGAQLRVVLALALKSDQIYTAEAAIRGVIPEAPSAKYQAGFPYRALLFLPELNKFYDHDQLTPEEMDKINHRKAALSKIRYVLIKRLPPQAVVE